MYVNVGGCGVSREILSVESLPSKLNVFEEDHGGGERQAVWENVNTVTGMNPPDGILLMKIR